MASKESARGFGNDSNNKKNSNSTADWEAEEAVDWEKIQSLSSEPAPLKRRKKIRQIPEGYFLPRRSLPSALALYGSFFAAGLGAAMLVEKWIQKKVAEDGGTLWDLSK